MNNETIEAFTQVLTRYGNGYGGKDDAIKQLMYALKQDYILVPKDEIVVLEDDADHYIKQVQAFQWGGNSNNNGKGCPDWVIRLLEDADTKQTKVSHNEKVGDYRKKKHIYTDTELNIDDPFSLGGRLTIRANDWLVRVVENKKLHVPSYVYKVSYGDFEVFGYTRNGKPIILKSKLR